MDDGDGAAEVLEVGNTRGGDGNVLARQAFLDRYYGLHAKGKVELVRI